MANVYKITKEEAALIGEFDYGTNQMFSPYSTETIDGCYVIFESLYLLLQDREEIQRVDFSQKQLYDFSEIIFKEPE